MQAAMALRASCSRLPAKTILGETLESRQSGTINSFRPSHVKRRLLTVLAAVDGKAPARERELPMRQSEVRENKVEDSGVSGLPFSAKSLKEAADQPAVKGAGQAAIWTGAAAIGLLITATLLDQVDTLPLLPQAMQLIGVVYCGFIARRYLMEGGNSAALMPESPVKYVMDIVETPTKQDVKNIQTEAVRLLAEERDIAFSQMETMKKKTGEMARVVAEKEALEAVAIQLAEERDSAVSEMTALKSAVEAMTERMKSIETMLEREVQQLKVQNQALETVALQLASERDAALTQVAMLNSQLTDNGQSAEEMSALESVAMRLAQERDQALEEVKHLKQVMLDLRTAASSQSGLTSEQEDFIKARAQAIRAQFIDIKKSYDDQKEAADVFVQHLVEEYGAPRDWTAEYLKMFLNSASAGNNSSSSASSGISNPTTNNAPAIDPFYEKELTTPSFWG